MNLREITIKQRVSGACPKCFASQLHMCIVERDQGAYQMLVCAACRQLVSVHEIERKKTDLAEVERSIRQRLETWAELYPKGSLCYDE